MLRISRYMLCNTSPSDGACVSLPISLATRSGSAWEASSSSNLFSRVTSSARSPKFFVSAAWAFTTARRKDRRSVGCAGAARSSSSSSCSSSSSSSSSFSTAASELFSSAAARSTASTCFGGMAQTGAYSSRGVPFGSVFSQTDFFSSSMWQPAGLPRGHLAADSNFAPNDFAACLQTFSFLMRSPSPQLCEPNLPITTALFRPPPHAQQASFALTPSLGAQAEKFPFVAQPGPYRPSGRHQAKSSYAWQLWLVVLRHLFG
mmetsp:Transcript_129374/g.362173  ORF Transcript_129374/g.362173 Transcript_129374/m.362173 type:complete len:261 (+) Transcript_129374:278-1060(+)